MSLTYLFPLFLIGLCVAGTIYLVRHRRLLMPVRLGPDVDPAAAPGLARLRHRNILLAGGAFCLLVIGLMLATASSWWPVVAVAVAVMVPLAVIAVRPDPVQLWRTDGDVRRADLAPRSARAFGPAWGFVLPVAACVVLIAFLIACGVISGMHADSTRNRQLALTGADWSASAGPFPGWYYGVPIGGLAIAVVALTLVALHRIARWPAPSTPGARDVDAFARELSARFVMKLSAFAVVGYLGGSMVAAGIACSGVAGAIEGLAAQSLADLPPVQEIRALAVGLTVVAVILLVCALGFLAGAIVEAIVPIRTARSPRAVAAVEE